MNNKLEAFFFDLDGTLLDTSTDLLIAFNYVLEKHGAEPVKMEQLIPFISKGSKQIISSILKQGVPENSLVQYASEFLDAYHTLGHTHTDFFPGMKKVIKTLNDNSISWGIITNKTEKLTFPVVEKLNLTELGCKTVVCADTTEHAKPHPAPMLKACTDLNVDPKKCMFIGDAETDVEAGKAVGMTTIAAGYGFIPKDCDITTWGADHIIHSVMELHQLLN